MSKRFVVTNYIFKTPKVKGQGFRVVMLSDLHNKCYGVDNDSLIQAIDNAHPDMIICAGDMITAVKGHESDWTTTYSFLENLTQRYQVFYGLGNHESRLNRHRETFGTGYEELVSRLKEIGVRVLVNEHEHLNIKNNNICITGLDIAGIYYKRFSFINMPEDYLPIKLGDSDPEAVNLLIAHNPDYFGRYKEWGADISFSGHLHGGVMRIPGIGGVISPQFHLFPRYSGDMYLEDGKAIVVSKGIGEHTIPIRINNPAEVVVLDVVEDDCI